MWPVLSLAVSSSHRQCTIDALIIDEFARGVYIGGAEISTEMSALTAAYTRTFIRCHSKIQRRSSSSPFYIFLILLLLLLLLLLQLHLFLLHILNHLPNLFLDCLPSLFLTYLSSTHPNLPIYASSTLFPSPLPLPIYFLLPSSFFVFPPPPVPSPSPLFLTNLRRIHRCSRFLRQEPNP